MIRAHHEEHGNFKGSENSSPYMKPGSCNQGEVLKQNHRSVPPSPKDILQLLLRRKKGKFMYKKFVVWEPTEGTPRPSGLALWARKPGAHGAGIYGSWSEWLSPGEGKEKNLDGIKALLTRRHMDHMLDIFTGHGETSHYMVGLSWDFEGLLI